MATTCPACGGTEVRKLPELWEELRSGTSETIERLVAAMPASPAGPGSEAGSDPEATRALLAQELAPPEKKYDLPLRGSCLQMSAGIAMVAAGLVMVIVATIRLARTRLGIHQILLIVLGGLAVAALGYAIGRIGFPKPTYREYEERLEAWRRTYRCMNCGTHFAPDAE